VGRPAVVVIVRSVVVVVVIVVVVVVVCEESAHLVAVSAELLAGEAKRAEQLGNRRICHGSSLRRRPGKKKPSAHHHSSADHFFSHSTVYSYTNNIIPRILNLRSVPSLSKPPDSRYSPSSPTTVCSSTHASTHSLITM